MCVQEKAAMCVSNTAIDGKRKRRGEKREKYSANVGVHKLA